MELKDLETQINKTSLRPEYQKNVDSIVNGIKGKLNGQMLTIDNIMSFAANSISLTEKIKNIPGLEKKNILIESLNNIVDSQDMKDDMKIIVKSSIDFLLSHAIDVFVDISKGKIKLTDNAFCNLFKGCCFK